MKSASRLPGRFKLDTYVAPDVLNFLWEITPGIYAVRHSHNRIYVLAENVVFPLGTRTICQVRKYDGEVAFVEIQLNSRRRDLIRLVSWDYLEIEMKGLIKPLGEPLPGDIEKLAILRALVSQGDSGLAGDELKKQSLLDNDFDGWLAVLIAHAYVLEDKEHGLISITASGKNLCLQLDQSIMEDILSLP